MSMSEIYRYTMLTAAILVVAVLSSTQIAYADTSTESVRSGLPLATEIYDVFQLDGDQDFGDFVVGPGKFDIFLSPGESQTVELLITNRTGVRKEFVISAEDMVGSRDIETPTVLLGEDRGPYTLRDFISVEADRFLIEPGERVTVPVTITLPLDAEPGGRYGSVLVETASQTVDGQRTAAAAIVSRIAVLFFVTTPGELDVSGALVDFTTVPDRHLFSNSPITFGLLYENTGSVHTTPAGSIIISNMFGQTVGSIDIEPWFSLPQSLRLREVVWQREALLGRYTASAEVSRGYSNETDTLMLTFWVIDWLILGAILLSLIFVFSLLRLFTNRFTITRR